MKKKLSGLVLIPAFFISSNLFGQKIPEVLIHENYINVENPLAENLVSCQRVANGFYGLHLKSGDYEKSIFGKSKEFGDYQFYINLGLENKGSDEKWKISKGVEIKF